MECWCREREHCEGSGMMVMLMGGEGREREVGGGRGASAVKVMEEEI